METRSMISMLIGVLVTTSAATQRSAVPFKKAALSAQLRDSLQAIRKRDSAAGLPPDPTRIWNGSANQERKTVSWPYLREADVFWAKRITRVIDMREKQNQCMKWPGNPLNLILYKAVLNGKLTPYKNDSFTSIIPIAEFAGKGSDTEFVDNPVSAENPDITEPDTAITLFDPLVKIVKFRVTEDWIFDKKRSEIYVRIIAIAPVFTPTIAGYDLGEQDLCVLKYHRSDNDMDLYDVQEILVNQEIFNRQNLIRFTFDDWFEQRLFSSYIIKEENQHDYTIKEFDEFKDDKAGALLESENIKYKLFEMEHDLWEY